jgi:hypothetical protein
MNRPSKARSFVTSTVGTTLVCILAVWVSLAFAPVVATHNFSHSQLGHRLFQISPIPPGADWTA